MENIPIRNTILISIISMIIFTFFSTKLFAYKNENIENSQNKICEEIIIEVNDYNYNNETTQIEKRSMPQSNNTTFISTCIYLGFFCFVFIILFKNGIFKGRL